jgi:hypothetical protein
MNGKSHPSPPHPFATFNKTFRWALCGSISFELIILAHASALCSVIGLANYGRIVTINSIICLVAHIADFGATNSIAPFLHHFMYSKQNFKHSIMQYTLVPHLPLILATTALSLFILQKTTLATTNNLMLALIVIITLLELIQNFLRQFLYTLFETKMVVTTELFLLTMRIGSLWWLHFFAYLPLSITVILWSHCVSILLCLLFFSRKIIAVYHALPDKQLELPKHFAWRLAKNRFFNYLLRLSRNLFTTNFITPLFAIQFGLKTAGLFFLASKFAKIIQAAVKICIGYSGNGLLAHTKNGDLLSKQTAFAQLWNKLIGLVAPAGIFFVLGCSLMMIKKRTPALENEAMMLSCLFLVLTFLEFFFQLYEQFYSTEEQACKIFFVKLFELSALFIITMIIKKNPAFFLFVLVGIRSLTLLIIASDAYKRWGIKPALAYKKMARDNISRRIINRKQCKPMEPQ